MQSEEVQEYLAERLASSLSDRLSGTVHAYVRTHMLSCSECCQEMDNFEEIQAALRSIPMEPFDPKATRARFDLRNEAEEPQSSLGPVKTILATVAAIVVLAAAVFAVRQAWIWPPVAKGVPAVPAPKSPPAAAPAIAVPEGSDSTPVVSGGKPTPPGPSSELVNVSGGVSLEDGGEVKINVFVRSETGKRLPYKPDTSIVFTGTKGTLQIVASPFVGNLFRVTVPEDNAYNVAVSNIAAGYSIQSIVDGNMTDLMHGDVFTVNSGKAAPARIVITLSEN